MEFKLLCTDASSMAITSYEDSEVRTSVISEGFVCLLVYTWFYDYQQLLWG